MHGHRPRLSSGLRGLVRLAFLESLATSLVPDLLRGSHQASPGTRVQLSQEPAHDILADLESGTVGVAVTSAPPDGPWG